MVNVTPSSINDVMDVIQVPVLLLILVVANLVSLTYFAVDKVRSQRGKWRIPESKLLVIGFFGPFGAYLGMVFFRHKTRRVKFLLIPIFLVIQFCLIVYYYLR